MATRSDATTFPTSQPKGGKVQKNNYVQTTSKTSINPQLSKNQPNVTVVKGGPLPPGFQDVFNSPFFASQGNFAPHGNGNIQVTNFSNSGGSQPLKNTSQATVIGPEHQSFPSNFDAMFQRNFPDPNSSGTRTQKLDGVQRNKRVKNTFRINNSTIDSLAYGNKQNVSMKTDVATYKEGASKTSVNVHGGTLVQPNIDGDADYDNKDATLSASKEGTGIKKGDSAAGFSHIDELDPPFSPEQYLAKLLQTGISAADLISLLEYKYSVEKLAYAIPSSKCKRDLMIGTMLKMAQMSDN